MSLRAFVLDLETSARDDCAAFIEEPQPPANYKDLAKIEAWLADKRARQLEQCALDATTARVLCVGVLRESSGVGFIHDDDEATLLTRTWGELGTFEPDEVFITFNGSRFDFPMLIRRSYALGVRVPGWVPLDGRWRESRHMDLMLLWGAGDRTATISLDTLARLTGVGAKSGDGKDFGKMWIEDRTAALKYLENDLVLTRDLWRRMMRGVEIMKEQDMI